MFRGLGFPRRPQLGQAQVFDGLAWVFAYVAIRLSALTTGRIPKADASGNLVDSQIADGITGNVLTIGGVLSGARAQTARDASGNLCLDSVDNGFTAAQTMRLSGAGTAVVPLRVVNTSGTASSAAVVSFDPGDNGVGVRDAQIRGVNDGANRIRLEFYTSNAATPALVGTWDHLGNLGIGVAPAASNGLLQVGSSLGAATSNFQAYFHNRFGLLARASAGAYNPTVPVDSVVLLAHGLGVDANTLVLGTHASTASAIVLNTNGAGIGVSPTAGNGLVQLASGTTVANAVRYGDTPVFRTGAGQLLQNGPAATDIFYTVQRSTGETAQIFTVSGGCGIGSQSNHLLAIRTNNTNAIVIDTVQGVTTLAANYVKTRSVAAAAGTTTLDGTDDTSILTGATTQTFTLPAAAAGRRLFIKNRSSGALTVNRAGADTIDGLTTLNVAAGTAKILIANGTDWCVWNA